VSTHIRALLWLPLAAALLASACSNQSDPRWLDAGESLIPPESEVTEVIENTSWLSLETGPYWASYNITGGGLGAALEGAIHERARAAGWEPTERSEELDAIQLRFVRDDLKALVRVWINRDPVDASITIHSAE
jgi:hypothetical protein